LWLTGLALLTNILTVGAALLVALKPFIGPRTETPRHPHRAPLTLWGGTALLGTLSLLFGLFPALLDSIISATATWMYHKPVEAHLALWHGFTPMLLLSVITLTLGYGAYALNARWLALGERVQTTAAFLPARLFWRSLNALEIMAHKLTLTLHNGKLRNYLLVIVLSTVVLGIIGFLSEPFGIDFSATVFSEQTDPRVFTLFELFFILIMPIGAFMAVMATAPLIAVAALGVIGFAMAVVYIMFAAPDLAMTQFAIETLAVLLFVLVLRKLPAFESHTELRQRIRDGLIASTVGVFITLLTLSMLAERHPLPLFESLLEKSVKAKGLNVVNVILVDIRGFDTLGEVTVLAVAAIGVYALLKFRRGGTDYFLTNLDLATQETFSKIRINSLILSATLRVVLPLLVMFSIFLFLRGHNEPGGGFIGGLSAAAAFSLYAIAEGMQKAFRSLRFHTRNFINWGLLIALSSGFLSFIFAPDKPFAFMRGVWMTQELPIIGKFGSPTVFDLGVELVVFGVTLTIIYALMEVLD
jgi:multicomponent Na+:H+ antiporter subunit A